MERYYTVEEIAELLSMHPKTIQRYIREGKLRAKKVGKSWRISGHDLSTFTEGSNMVEIGTAQKKFDSIRVSSVIDIHISNFEESTKITNMLMAATNSKSDICEGSTVYTQYSEYEKMLRITLWGTLFFVQKMLEILSIITSQCDNDTA